MFASLLKRLTQTNPDTLPDDDARLALTALLVRIAKSDGTYGAEEIARIDQITARRYGLNPVTAAQLRARAEVLENEAPDTVRFTRAIKDAVPFDDRAGVVEALWDIVLADGTRDSHEDQLLRLIAPMLGLTDPDSANARRRAEARRGLTQP
jgi:uncharacterized tellurite resistance protein B-like protein